MKAKNNSRKSSKERGVALLFALFALLLLSAVAASLVLMSNTDTAIDSSFRRERSADYAAKAGFEEARDRMRASTVPNPPLSSISASLPQVLPPANGSVLYLLNEGANVGSVQPWNTSNAYMDDELCHDGYTMPGLQAQSSVASDVRCTTLPNGGSWYVTANSWTGSAATSVPWAGTAAAIPYKWVRMALKVNGMNPAYPVNPAQPLTSQVCWNGATEVILSGAATCQAMSPSTNPVYIVTSLAVTGTGTRKIVQTELALDPLQPFPYGLYATGTSCTALQFSGGGNSNPATDSFTTANGGTYAGTGTDTGGDVGSNGGVVLTGHSMIGGSIGVQSTSNPSLCNYNGGDISTSGSAGTYQPNNYPGNVPTQVPVYTFPTPPDPSPLPPNTAYNGSLSIVPGTYGNISLSGKQTLTLAPGTYNLYSLSMSGQSSIVVNPPGAVVLNFPAASQSPITISGQGVMSNTTVANSVANNVDINYGGTGTVQVSGNGASVMNLNAPNAAVTVSGNGDVYGRIIGQTLNWSGNGKFHFDKNSALAPQNSGFYTLISFRQVSY